jgi:hypothetical protein
MNINVLFFIRLKATTSSRLYREINKLASLWQAELTFNPEFWISKMIALNVNSAGRTGRRINI